MKVASNTVHVAQPGTTIPFGNLIKAFGKHFKSELKERNSVHHHERFEDIRLDNIAIISIAASSKDERLHLKRRMRSSYREATREWAQRVRRRSTDVEAYLEASASLILSHCAFLGDSVPEANNEASIRNDAR